MSLQWRHLKMLKRGGRGHDPSGIAGTQDGELAIACPSCPIPGVNLPSDWEDAAEGASGYAELPFVLQAPSADGRSDTYTQKYFAWMPTSGLRTSLYPHSRLIPASELAWPTWFHEYRMIGTSSA